RREAVVVEHHPRVGELAAQRLNLDAVSDSLKIAHWVLPRLCSPHACYCLGGDVQPVPGVDQRDVEDQGLQRPRRKSHRVPGPARLLRRGTASGSARAARSASVEKGAARQAAAGPSPPPPLPPLSPSPPL